MTHDHTLITRHMPPRPSPEELAADRRRLEADDAFSWGALIFNGNCRRLLNVLTGSPEVFISKNFPNPNRIPDTVALIVDPGPEYGRDERHCFLRLARALTALPEKETPFTEAVRNFSKAALQEIGILRDFCACGEVIDYEEALRSLLSVVFEKTLPYAKSEDYQREVIGKCLALANARQALYKRYVLGECRLDPARNDASSRHDKLNEIAGAVYALNDKVVETGRSIKKYIGRKTDEACSEILAHLPDGESPKVIRQAMRQRAFQLIKQRPDLSLRSICECVIKEYEGIVGAYENAETLRKALSRSSN